MPMYRRIVDALRTQIDDGVFQPEARIPTEQEIARIYRVSRITARAAVQELETSGLVYRIRGKGTFVSPEKAEPPPEGSSRDAAGLSIVSVVLPIGRHAGHDILSGLEAEAKTRAFQVTFHNSLFDSEHERELVEQVTAGGSRGVVVYPCKGISNLDLYTNLCSRRYPLVFVDRRVECVPVPVVASDNFAGFRALTTHVLSMGHRHVAFLGNSLDGLESERERLRGFCQAHVDARLPVRRELIRGTETHEHGMVELLGPGRAASDIAALEGALAALLAAEPRPTCVMAVNDATAFHLVRAASAMDVSVPEELSITGFDDLEMGAHLPVPLTTVRQAFVEMGRTAARIIFDLIDDPARRTSGRTIETELVIRRSVAPPQAAGGSA